MIVSANYNKMKFLVLFVFMLRNGHARNTQRECRVSGYGSEYMGIVNTTVSGLECQNWNDQYPHAHTYVQGEYFPDGTMEAIYNYCRNPDVYHEGPWCYTMDPEVRWELCDVSHCHDMPECKITDSGTEYHGSMDITKSGSKCQPWSGEYANLEHTYCRNPDGKPLNPWCFVTDDEWEYCEVPFCKPSASCIIGSGWDYAGTVAVTKTGRICQRWDMQWPHSHLYTDPDLFLEDSLEEVENYCRNPADDKERPWCFTTSPNLIWEYCDIPQCIHCKVNAKGRGYAGQMNQTHSGTPCQRWDSMFPHSHEFTDSNRFPDANIAFASNYCRNPDGRQNGPWCFTTDPEIEWEYCDIPSCDADCKDFNLINSNKRQIARHILHIGVDGLDPCFVNATQGAQNLLHRLADQGSFTLDGARNVMPAFSGPNWAAHLTGLNVPDSGVTSNGWGPSWRGYTSSITAVTGHNVPFQTIASYLRSLDENTRTAVFQDWDWLVHMTNYGHPGSLHKEMYCSVEEESQDYMICDDYLVGNATMYLENIFDAAETSYTFVYLAELDVVGHSRTWCNTAYLKYVDVIDEQVGRLLDVIDNMDVWDDTLVILSTDHGGFAFSHGWDSDRDIPIPMFLRGSGVRVNHELTNPVRNYDIAPTIAHALGVQPSPWWSGKIMIQAFEDE